MEIKVNVQKFANVSTKSVKVDKDAFMKDLLEFIDNIENKEFLDQALYDKLVALGINKSEFDKMIVELQKFAEYDDDKPRDCENFHRIWSPACDEVDEWYQCDRRGEVTGNRKRNYQKNEPGPLYDISPQVGDKYQEKYAMDK